jgi:hypothetical protein
MGRSVRGSGSSGHTCLTKGLLSSEWIVAHIGPHEEWPIDCVLSSVTVGHGMRGPNAGRRCMSCRGRAEARGVRVTARWSSTGRLNGSSVLTSRRPSRYRPLRVLPDLRWFRVIGGGSMKNVDPYESIAVTRRDYQELLMSFRQVVDERNALLREVERLLSTREYISDQDLLPDQRRAG